MTDHRRRSPVLRETLAVVLVSAGLALSLIALVALNRPGALGKAVESAAASIDPGIGSRAAAVRDSLEQGSIVVAGVPAGFFVRLDGLAYSARDGAGLEIRTKAGSHRVEIRNRHGDSWVTRVSVPQGGRIGVRPALGGEIVIEPAAGEPLPGDVYLDGRRLDQVPAIIDSAAVGTHTAEIRSDMGVLWRSDIVVRNGAVTQVPLPPKFRITAEN